MLRRIRVTALALSIIALSAVVGMIAVPSAGSIWYSSIDDFSDDHARCRLVPVLSFSEVFLEAGIIRVALSPELSHLSHLRASNQDLYRACRSNAERRVNGLRVWEWTLVVSLTTFVVVGRFKRPAAPLPPSTVKVEA